MKLLRLTPALKSTSASYNQFFLGYKKTINQTIGSLHKHEVSIDKKVRVFHGDGSIIKMSILIRRMVTEDKYDVIHIHNGITGLAFLLSIFPFKLSLLKRTVFTLHNSWNVLKTRNQVLNFIVMLISKEICACGISSYNSIPRSIKFFIGNKTRAIVNGFDHQRIDNIESERLRETHFDSESKIKIIYIGAFNNTKNQMAFLEAIKTKKLEAEVIFLGDGANMKSSIDFSEQITNKTKITFKGLVSREEAIEHMLEADIFVSLSKGEGMPIAVLEAMYAGCFLILSKIPPHIEISAPSDRSQLVDLAINQEILRSLDYIRDNIQIIKRGRGKSKKHSIDNFSVRNMLDSYREVYDSVYEINN